MWVLSGVFLSAQRPAHCNRDRGLPLTALIDALRANMLQGAGFAQIERELAAQRLAHHQLRAGLNCFAGVDFLTPHFLTSSLW
jgi:hypothetical protein